nr:MAG TPA: hypothetical protein [Caudoviricetes sp.]
MIDLTKKSLPNTVLVGGRDFKIHTDFRIWLRFVIEFEEWREQNFKGVLDIRYLFKDEIPEFCCIEDYGEILEFAFPKNVVPRNAGVAEKVLYYKYDGDYLYSAFMEQYGIDLLDDEFHWYKFNALLNGLNNTKMNEIMEFRSYTGEKVRDMDSQYRRLKETWIPPEEETEEEKEAEERFNNYFG